MTTQPAIDLEVPDFTHADQLRAQRDEAHATAAAAHLRAEQLDAEAQLVVLQVGNARRARVNETMRALSDRLEAARQTAIDAVRECEGGAALTAWLKYRRLGAEIRGHWEAVAGDYALAGEPAPPGPSYPEQEGFDKFVHAVTTAVERDVRRDTGYRIGDELLAKRRAARQSG